jgi:hypothetical protein
MQQKILGDNDMKTLKSALLTAVLTVTVSSPTFAGTIIAPRSSRTGTILATRTGTILATRTSNQATPRNDTAMDRSRSNQGFGILLSENIFGVMRLFLESSLF